MPGTKQKSWKIIGVSDYIKGIEQEIIKAFAYTEIEGAQRLPLCLFDGRKTDKGFSRRMEKGLQGCRD